MTELLKKTLEIWQIVKPYLFVLITYIIPLIAIGLSIWSSFESKRVRKFQKKMDDIELLLKQYALEEKEKERKEETLANVEARAMKISKNNYKVRFWNSGKATAYEVDFSVPEGYSADIIKQNTPYKYLEPGKSFDELFAVHMGTSSNFPIITLWKDKDGKAFSKEQMVSW